jgi:PRC-barrel domain
MRESVAVILRDGCWKLDDSILLQILKRSGGAMLHRERRLKGALVRGTDGDLGILEQLYFDDEQWAICQLVVGREKALNGGSALISPTSIQPDWNVAMLVSTMSQHDVRNLVEVAPDAELPLATGPDTAHVRRTDQIIGLHLHATDGEIGHVDDLLIDEDTWRIRYLVVDTSNWIGGKWVAIIPSVLRSIDWANGTLEVAITRDAVKNSPSMDSLAVPSAETMPPFVLM